MRKVEIPSKAVRYKSVGQVNSSLPPTFTNAIMIVTFSFMTHKKFRIKPTLMKSWCRKSAYLVVRLMKMVH
jgi:hypothetical protein